MTTTAHATPTPSATVTSPPAPTRAAKVLPRGVPAAQAAAGVTPLGAPAVTRSHLLLAAGVAAVAVAVGWEAWADIAMIAYREEEASHIFLVPIIVAWIVWSRLDHVLAARRTHQWVGPVMIAVAAGLEWFGFTQQVDAAWHLGAVLLAAGGVVSVLGGDLLWRAWPAFAVLGFLVPVPGMIRLQLAMPLQEFSAAATEVLMNAVGFDVERSVNLLVFNGVEVGVAEACNGMRMFFALLLVLVAFAFAMPLKPWVRVLVLVTSPIVAIACNIIRLGPTVWVYGMYPETAFAESVHTLGGWAMLGVAFGLLLGVVKLLEWAEVPVMQKRPAVEPPVSEPPPASPHSADPSRD